MGETGEQSSIVLGMLMPVASLGSLCTGCTGCMIIQYYS